MSRLVTYFVRFVAMLAGFGVACLAASLFVNLLLASTVVAVVPEFSDAARPALFAVVPFFTLVLANFAFVPFLIVAMAAEFLGWRSWLAHALAGGVVALHVGWQMAQAFERPDAASDPGLMLFTLAAGLVGGIAYWAVAGRNAGNWRDEVGAPST